MCTQLNAKRSRTKPAPSRIIWPSITTKKRRRIRFGTTNASNQLRALIFSFSAMAIMFAWLCLAIVVRECTEELDKIQRNITGVRPRFESLQCLVLNRQCNCRMLSNTTHVHDSCIPRLQLHVMKILPLLSLVLQPFALREFFTFDGECTRVFVRMAWGVSAFAYAAIVIAMFSNHCYHDCLILSICVTSTILFLFGMHELRENRIVARKEEQTVS